MYLNLNEYDIYWVDNIVEIEDKWILYNNLWKIKNIKFWLILLNLIERICYNIVKFFFMINIIDWYWYFIILMLNYLYMDGYLYNNVFIE